MKENQTNNVKDSNELVLASENIDIEQSRKGLDNLLPTAKLIDDYYFTLYAQCYPEDFSMIVSTFLDKEIDIDISTVRYQKSLNLPDDGKDVRFDVAANTKDGGQVVLEVESKKKFSELRLRYYMSRMDADLLYKGEQYKNLRDSYIIAVSPVDIREQNKPRYFIRNCYVESPTVVGESPAIVDNGQIAVYINASYQNEKDNSKLADLIHDFTCENPDEIKTKIIREHSTELKSKRRRQNSMIATIEDQLLRLPLYNGRLLTENEQREAEERGMGKKEDEIFKNLMTPFILNNQDNISQGIQICKTIIPDWDNDKIQEKLTSLQKKFKIELNFDKIFPKEDIINKIKDKDFDSAYRLFDKNKNISNDENALDFMKEVVKIHGTNKEMLKSAVEAVTEAENGLQEFSSKLLNNTLKTDEYKNAFNQQSKTYNNDKTQ